MPIRERRIARKAFLCLGALCLVGGLAVAQAAPAHATPLPGSVSQCGYSNAATPANPAGVVDVTPGSTININCAAGSFAPGALMVIVEASGLAGIVSPSSSEINDVDLGSLSLVGTGSDGSLNTTFTVPGTFGASDSNATCPPTQAQINVGLTCDLVVISLSGLTPVNEAMLAYQGQGNPNRPTLHAKFSIHNGVKTIAVSDAPGACPTPPTDSSRCWWGAATTGSPNAAFGNVPAPEALLNFRTASSNLQVSPAIYCQSGATAPACASVPTGTLISPALSGTVTTHTGLGPFLTIDEPNATPYTGNSSLPDLIAGAQNVSATVPVPY